MRRYKKALNIYWENSYFFLTFPTFKTLLLLFVRVCGGHFV